MLARVSGLSSCWGEQPDRNVLCPWQHIDKMFKHKELQQQLMDTKLQRITEMMKEVEEKQQKERDLVSSPPCLETWRVDGRSREAFLKMALRGSVAHLFTDPCSLRRDLGGVDYFVRTSFRR